MGQVGHGPRVNFNSKLVALAPGWLMEITASAPPPLPTPPSWKLEEQCALFTEQSACAAVPYITRMLCTRKLPTTAH